MEENIFIKLDKQINDRYSESFVNKINRLGFYISKDGVSLKDACRILDIDYEKFLVLLKKENLLMSFVNLKKIEYKQKLLSALSKKAMNGDSKSSLFLLENNFPEFKKNKEEKTEDPLKEVIEFIQSSKDNDPLIKKSAGLPIGKPEEKKVDIVKEIEDILN